MKRKDFALRLAVITSLLLAALPSGASVSQAQTDPTNQTTQNEATSIALPYFTEPAISPDRNEIAFVSGGDIWTVPSAGGEASLLVSHNANESHPLYSPDGKMIAFERAGGEIRVLDAETKRERPVATANMDRPPLNSDRSLVWSPDNRFLAFFSAENRSFRNVYVAPVDGSASAATNVSQTNTTQNARQRRRTSGQPASFLANVFSNSISWSADGNNRRKVAIRPVNATTEKGLLYRRWVEDNRAYVARESNNRLGYDHLFHMSQASLNQLYIDLDAENQGREGVVIDVRNNNGGFVNAYAIDVFTRRGYLTMTQRGFAPAPARTQLGQRALEAPTILVTNQHSLSDAEDFTEGYRTLRLGKTVGEPTAGWIIFTTNVTLIDGTSFRLPFIKITANDGADMELNPRPVDVPVTRPIGETYSGRDAQLDAAVRELLGQIRN